MNHEGAFQCAKCPVNNDPAAGRSCPVWWEMIMREVQTGEVRTQKGCGLSLLPALMVDVTRSMSVAAANITQVREDIIQEVQNVGASAVKQQFLNLIAQRGGIGQSHGGLSPPGPMAERPPIIKAPNRAYRELEFESGSSNGRSAGGE